MLGNLLDLTVVVNCHREDELLRPTLNSIHESISFALSRGITCELLLIADNPSLVTSLECERWRQRQDLKYPVSLHLTKLGNPGAARNIATNLVSSKYLGFCDGDDLVSENYFFECLTSLELKDEPSIAHPEFLMSFGDWSGIWHISPEGINQSYRDLVSENLWCSSSVALTEIYQQVPYEPLTSEQGYGPEDWHWNIKTTERGFHHFSVKDTCFFYRKRNNGGVNNTHKNSLLPPIDFEALSTAFPYVPNNSITARSRIRENSTHLYANAKTKLGWLRTAFPRLSHFAYMTARRAYSLAIGLPTSQLGSASALGELKYSSKIKEQVQKATWIEPGISWTAFSLEKLHVHSDVDSTYAEVLEKLVNDLGNNAEKIVAVPWIGIGGADLVSINYANALSQLSENKKAIILSTGAPDRTRLDLIPSTVKFVQIDSRFQSFSEETRSRLLAQAFTICRPKLVIAVNCFDLVNSLRRYGKQISAFSDLYLTFFSFDRIGDNYPTQPITDGSREFLRYVSGILTDNKQIAIYLSQVLGRSEDFFRVHYQPAFGNNLMLEKQELLESPKVENQVIRLVWPHRLDKEKRPEALLEIAKLAVSQDVQIIIDVYGQSVLNDESKSLMREFKEHKINYLGPYQGGLASLPTENYHGLLITSESEGIPIVLLQSMMLGLPVISTNVGGISEVITDRVSGFLVDGPEDTQGFITAIKLLADDKFRAELSSNARKKVNSQHSWNSFREYVSKLS